MKKILFYSSGTLCSSIIAESLLKESMVEYTNIAFFSSGVLYDKLSIKRTINFLKHKNNIFTPVNTKTKNALIDKSFDLIFLLFKQNNEKIILPICKGNMYCIGYGSKSENIEYIYQQIKSLTNNKIKHLITENLSCTSNKDS